VLPSEATIWKAYSQRSRVREQRENSVGCHARARARKGDAERSRDEWGDDSADRQRISGGGRRRKSDRKSDHR
jgi:hypothetical protein